MLKNQDLFYKLLSMTQKDNKTVKNRQGSEARFLEAALVAFSKQGYEGATTREIALNAGLNEALIQRYFGGKSGLLFALITKFSKEQSDFTYPAGQTIEEEILNFLQARFKRDLKIHSFLRLFLSRALQDSLVAKEIKKHLENIGISILKSRLSKFPHVSNPEHLAYQVAFFGSSLSFFGHCVFKLKKQFVLDCFSSFSQHYHSL